MKIHRRLIVLVGLGMLLILTITVFSLGNLTSLFSKTTLTVGQIAREVRVIAEVEEKIDSAAKMMHEYVRTADPQFRKNYELLYGAANEMLRGLGTLDMERRELKVTATLVNDLNTLEGRAGQIFSLNLADPREREKAVSFITDIDSLVVWIRNDLDRYRHENSTQLDAVVGDLSGTKMHISILFGIMLLSTIGFLFVFGLYLYRKVALPLGQLWDGAEAISRGDLDHRVTVRGEGDVVMLADRFNEMAGKLKESYADLERRLLERTQQLGALNSVSLTLGQSTIMKELLQRSLNTVLDSFSDMEPRGGIFLCDPGGDTLSLTAHRGLSREFVAGEERIRMGECLCGIVAQTGEMICTDHGRCDPRHTRSAGTHDHAHIVVPLKSRGAVLGVMFLYPQRQFSLKPSDIQMFDTIGAQLGMAVENLRLYAEVKEASIKFWDLFENSRDILLTVDMSGNVTALNKALETFAAASKPSLMGKNVVTFLSDEGKATARRLLSGELPIEDRVYEFEVIRRDGSRAFVEVSGRVLRHRNRPVGLHLAARDVTEQKSLRQLLVQAERLAAIGQVGIAMRHEINNPLTTIIGNTELLLERYEQTGSDLKKRLDIILENSLRIADILKRLREMKQDRTTDYVRGVKMTDLGGERGKT